MTLQIRLSYIFIHPGEVYERTSWMNALYSWDRDSLVGPYDAEAMKRSALKRGKNFVRRD